MSNYNFNELTYKIKQSWYHVETSFSGKNDDRATNILYHWREIFDLEIECSNRDNSGTLSWNLPLRLFKLNIYARNLGNNEILYFDATENNAKERTVLLFLPEIDKLPVLDLAGNKYYRTIRLEFNYTR